MSTYREHGKPNRPRDILPKLLEGLSNQNWQDIVNLYAENVEIQ